MAHPLTKAKNFSFSVPTRTGSYVRDPDTQEWVAQSENFSEYTAIVREDNQKIQELAGKDSSIIYIKGVLIEPKKAPDVLAQTTYAAKFYDPYSKSWTEGEFIPFVIIQPPFAVVSRIMGNAIEGTFTVNLFDHAV
jgi:hypothetical protein